MLLIRRAQFLDIDAITGLCKNSVSQNHGAGLTAEQVRFWYGPVRLLSFFPNAYQHLFDVYVAQVEGKVVGMIQVSPVNATQTTWRIDRLVVNPEFASQEIGSLLIGWVIESYRNVRAWILETNISDTAALANYRERGFQSLAQQSYWHFSHEVLQQAAQQPVAPVEFRPVSNADAALMCELDTATMPPIVRNFYNRHLEDFRYNYLQRAAAELGLHLSQQERVFSYVYEAQRRVAIGAFDLQLHRNTEANYPHHAQLWVHPAYTWLYAPLMHTLARISSHYPEQGLEIASADYQPEREAYFTTLGAAVTERTLMMARSMFHKERESRNPLENLSLPDMLPKWQPVRNPIPDRIQPENPEPPAI